MHGSAQQASADRPPHVLIADDEPDIRDLLGRMLSKHGFGVTAAGDGLEALRQISNVKPDVLVLDVSMPRLNAIEVLEIASDLSWRVPIVCVISGVASEAQVEEVMRWGAADFFPKPLNLEALVSWIQSRLNAASGGGS